MTDMETKAWEAHRRRRAAAKEERDAKLRGRPAPDQWDKGGVLKKLNRSDRPMTRLDIRSMTFEHAIRKRLEGSGATAHESRFTKPAIGKRRGIRRARNKAARASRRRNRR